MVRPAEDEATLRNSEREPLDKLRPEFKEALERLKHKVFSAVRPKAVNGRALSGKMLATLASTYAAALNSGGVPTISTVGPRAPVAGRRGDGPRARGVRPHRRPGARARGGAARRGGRRGRTSRRSSASRARRSRSSRPCSGACTTRRQGGRARTSRPWSGPTRRAAPGGSGGGGPGGAGADAAAPLFRALATRLQRLRKLNSLVSERASTVALAALWKELVDAQLPVESGADARKRAKPPAAAAAAPADGAGGDGGATARSGSVRDLDDADAWLRRLQAQSDALRARCDSPSLGPERWRVFRDGRERALGRARAGGVDLGVSSARAARRCGGGSRTCRRSSRSASAG